MKRSFKMSKLEQEEIPKTLFSKDAHPKWHYIYFALALFDILMISSTLYMNHLHLDQYAYIVDSNSKTMKVLKEIAELNRLAGNANAPGNDIFDSDDLSLELPRYQISNLKFDQALEQLQKVNPNEDKMINEIKKSMESMRKEALLIFSYFKKHQHKAAASRMAEMDRKYALLLQSIAKLHNAKLNQQTTILSEHHRILKNSQKIEHLFSFLIICMVVGISLYGRKMSHFMKKKTIQDRLRMEQLEVAQRLAKIGSWELNLKNHHFIWSHEHYKIFEIEGEQSPEDLYQIYRQKIHPDDLFKLEEHFALAIKKKEGFKYNHRLLLENSRVKYVQLICSGPQNKQEVISGTCQDISAEAELQEEKNNIAEATQLFNSIDRAIMNSDSFYGMIQNILTAITHNKTWVLASYWEIDSKDQYLKLLGIKASKADRFFDFISSTRELNFIDAKQILNYLKDRKDPITMLEINSSDYFLKRSFKSFEHDWPKTVLPIVVYDQQTPVGILEIFSEEIIPPIKSLQKDFLALGTRIGQAREKIIIQDQVLIEQKRFKRLIEGLDASAIVSIANQKGEITFVNKMFTEITGYSEAELLGKNHRLIKSGQHNKEFFEEMWKTLLKNNLWQGEICNRKKNGELYWVSSVITPSEDAMGKPQYTSIRFDITERKKMENKIRANEEILKFALDGAGDGVWDWNIAQNTVYFSKRWKEMLGHEEDEIENTSEEWSKRIHPEDAERVTKDLLAHFKNGGDYKPELRMLCKDQSYKWILARGMVVSRDKEGNPVRMIGTHTDISRIKQAEAQLVQASKLASLGEISAGIAHEINNPLAIICGTIDLLPNFIENPDKFAAKIASIKKASGRISKIISGLKKFSRSTEEKNYTPHILSQIIKEAITLTEAMSKHHNVTVSSDLKTDSMILCDEIEIEQILINLINNAVDAVKSKEERWVKLEQLEDNHSVIVRITDSGTGISPSVEKKLFDPFFTTKPVGEGTGLGLSISKGILDSHNATISVLQNVPNTCFEIRFKKVKTTEQAA